MHFVIAAALLPANRGHGLDEHERQRTAPWRGGKPIGSMQPLSRVNKAAAFRLRQTTAQEQEEQVDSGLSFLSSTQAELLNEILARRNKSLFETIRRSSAMSRTEADDVMSVLSEELTDNLDDDWEPTEYGRLVNAVLAQFTAARVGEWP